jgi:hypothetical protein
VLILSGLACVANGCLSRTPPRLWLASGSMGNKSIESLRSSVQILLYWFLESVLDRSVSCLLLLKGTSGTLRLRCTCRFGHWQLVGGTRLRLILIIGHNFTVSLYSFFEFLTDVARRLLRHAASFEKEDREYQTDCAKTTHPRQT